jgi:type I restriction enzyme R subunit
LFAELGWQTVSAFEEILGKDGTLGREKPGEVVLLPRLRSVESGKGQERVLEK